jgi:hypothetical protein
MLEVVGEWMFAELSILETIASVSWALHQYERAGSFAPPAMSEVVDTVPEESATGTESVAAVSAPLSTSDGQEASLPQPAEAAEPTATTTTASVTEDVVGEAGLSSPRSVATNADEVIAPDEPAAALQERVAPEDTARAASMEIQEAEEGAGAALLRGAASGEAQTLALARTSWAATSESGDDTEDDEEVAARNTVERGLNWVRHTFDELILPATSVSFLVRLVSSILWFLREVQLILVLLEEDPRIIRSETSSCSARALCGTGPTGDAAGRSPGGGSHSRGERGVCADVP